MEEIKTVIEAPQSKSWIKEYALSSLITFLSVFCITFVGSGDVQSLGSTAAISIVLTAVRAGVKSVVEYLAAKATTNLVK